jgi:hypothetical protein
LGVLMSPLLTALRLVNLRAGSENLLRPRLKFTTQKPGYEDESELENSFRLVFSGCHPQPSYEVLVFRWRYPQVGFQIPRRPSTTAGSQNLRDSYAFRLIRR